METVRDSTLSGPRAGAAVVLMIVDTLSYRLPTAPTTIRSLRTTYMRTCGNTWTCVAYPYVSPAPRGTANVERNKRKKNGGAGGEAPRRSLNVHSV